jgi:hypothetical protein
MISIAVPELEVGILTISPVTYFTLPEGAVVTALVWVVFVVLESFVHPVIRTQEIRSNTRLDTRRFFLFIVLNEQGDYFKKSFYSYLLFHYHSAGPVYGSPDCSRGKRERILGKYHEKSQD